MLKSVDYGGPERCSFLTAWHWFLWRSVYVFRRSRDMWVEEAKVTAPDAAAGDRFGFGLAAAGGLIAIGADGKDSTSGAAYALAPPPLAANGRWVFISLIRLWKSAGGPPISQERTGGVAAPRDILWRFRIRPEPEGRLRMAASRPSPARASGGVMVSTGWREGAVASRGMSSPTP
jgi:hypothetical protein